MPDTVPVYQSSRHPFEIFTLVLCLLVGIPLLLGDARPGSVASYLPAFWENVWALGLSLGAGVALMGVVWRNRITGLLFEQVGLVSTGGACIVYAAAVISSLGMEALLAGGIAGSFGLACAWRWVQISRLLKRASFAPTILVTREDLR